jgi:hypothetical protein
MSMARYNIVFNVDYKTMAFCRRTFARRSTIRTTPIRCAVQRLQTMDMDAATCGGAAIPTMTTRLKYDEPRTINFNCNNKLSKLIYVTLQI